MKRPLTDVEKKVIRQVAEKLPKDKRPQLLEDMAHALAETAADDGSRIVFDIPGYERPIYRGQHSFGVEGELLDRDGTKLSFDLYADEKGRLLELEVVRWGEGNLIDPDWNTLKLH